MNTHEEIKKSVRDKYAEIVTGTGQLATTPSSCCGGTSCCSVEVDMTPTYSAEHMAAVPDGADLGLGCGTPATFADITEGQTVLDLGSGAGIDCFIAAKIVGPGGKVIGVDMTQEMIARANENARKVGSTNVEFRFGDIESLPVDANTVDRVISNCVINLVPDKSKAFAEIHRVLKPGGSFTVSDIVTDGAISDQERRDASLWAGCISGAIEQRDYLALARAAGFNNVTVVSSRGYDYKLQSGGGLLSITVSGSKN